ncbi:MAG: hypothetical protein ACKVH0_07475 [Alphaproteobacteria bacterium]|jgi:predicted dehydrogenase
MYARDLISNDEIGEIVTANLSVMVPAITERGDGRIWQGIRANGANPMTIPGGHSIAPSATSWASSLRSAPA